MTTNSDRSSHTCRVVVGPDAVLTPRADSPEVPVVAVDDATSPTQAAKARSSRRAAHDLAGAVNVIGLAAEVGRSGAIAPLDALQQIAVLAKEAGEHLDALESSVVSPRSSPSDEQALDQANILEGVVRHAPLAESLDDIVAAIEHQLPETACSILLLRSGRTLHHGAGAKLPATYREAIDGVAIGLGQGSCGTAAFTGRPVVASDVTTDENWVEFRDVATAHGLRSCWSTPIVAAEGGEVLGTFAVYKTTVWNPDRTVVRLVERFTYLAAVAIEHHRLFGALAESESRFRSAFEGAAAGMALVQLDGTLIEVNPAMSMMLGPTDHAMSRTNLLDLIDPTHRRHVTDVWDHLAHGNEQLDVRLPANQRSPEVPLAAPHQSETVWVSLSTSIITDQTGGQRYFYVVVRDISADRRHLEEQRARKIAEASNEAKTDFLALVSHELRTPLNAILGFAQVMQMVDLDPGERADGVDQIARAGEHLRDLIDELLDLSRIEAGQLAVVAEEVDPAVVIDEVLNLVRPLASSRDIELIGDPLTGAMHRVHADRRCIRQVLINLVANAVKYIPVGGRVRVDVSVAPDEMVRIGVTDSGPGIASESIAELFEPFQRLERDGDANAEGTGLGLALSARLMDEMGGRIGVESTLGTGSCFWVDLPRSDSPSQSTSSTVPAPAVLPGGALVPGCGVVLYIEDDAASVGVMSSALALRPGIELRTAGTAGEGAQAAQSCDVDVVLLDIGLPDRSGWELLGDLRSTRPDMPVVVVTAGGDHVPEGCSEPDELVTKPFDIAEVLRAIDGALTGSPCRDQIAQPLDSFDERRKVDGLQDEAVESAVDGVASHAR